MELLEDLHEHPERIAELTTPQEVHAIACVWNWDDSATARVLGQIITHPLCDLATACVIFDEGEFLDLLENEKEDDFDVVHPGTSEENKAFFRLALAIIERLRTTGFSSQQIRLPATPPDTKVLGKLKHTVPDVLFTETPGEVYDYPRNVWM